MANYAWSGRSRGKLRWRLVAILTCEGRAGEGTAALFASRDCGHSGRCADAWVAHIRTVTQVAYVHTLRRGINHMLYLDIMCRRSYAISY